MPATDASQLIQQGVLHQRAGQLAGAIDLYLRVLKEKPNPVQALMLLGHADLYQWLGRLGQRAEALGAARRAVVWRPGSLPLLLNLANILSTFDEFDEADAAFREAHGLLSNAPASQRSQYFLALAINRQ